MDTAHRIPPRSVLSIAGLLALALWASPVGAQTPPASGTDPAPGATGGSPGVGVSVTPPSAPAVPPSAPKPWGFGFEQAIPTEPAVPREDHGERTRTFYQPNFVNGAVRTTRTSRTSGIRYGLSGWTSSRIPWDDRESSGFPAIGFTIEWGVPMEPPAEPAKPAQR